MMILEEMTKADWDVVQAGHGVFVSHAAGWTP
jgi:hypothetical protein